MPGKITNEHGVSGFFGLSNPGKSYRTPMLNMPEVFKKMLSGKKAQIALERK
jgi:hypothetical protein